jgi:O-antigen ligase
MSSRAAVGTTLWRGARVTLPVVAAGCAATVAVLAAQRFPADFVAPAAVAVLVVFVIRAYALPALLPIALVRATMEVWQEDVVVRALGIQLSPADVLTIAILLGCVWLLVDLARAGTPVWRAPTAVPAAVLLTIATVSLSYSSAPALGARDLAKFATAYAVYLVVVTARPNAEWLKRLLAVVVAGAIVPMAVGWWQFAHSIGKAGSGGLRIQSTFDHPNTYGFYLVAIIAAAWGLRWEVSPRVRPLVDALGIAALASTALTLSRNAWGALLVLIVVIGWRDRRVLIAAAACAVVAAGAMPRLIARATQFADSGVQSNSLVSRIDLWGRDLVLWRQQPVIGQGWGSVSADVSGAAHSDFIRALTEAGVIGFAAYVVFVGSIVVMGIRSGSSRSDLPRAFLGLAIGFVLVSFASNNLGKGAFQFYFWLIAGIAYVWSTTIPDARSARKATVAGAPA